MLSFSLSSSLGKTKASFSSRSSRPSRTDLTRQDRQRAVKWLNIALERRAPEDQAIALGIALESLLTFGRRQTQEITFKTAVRGAWLLGGDDENRRRNFEFVHMIYKLRSDAVHGGKVDPNVTFKQPKRTIPISDFLSEARGVVGSLLIAILEKGSWPDWDDLVLNAL